MNSSTVCYYTSWATQFSFIVTFQYILQQRLAFLRLGDVSDLFIQGSFKVTLLNNLSQAPQTADL